jgi:hypothetical protein
LRLVSISERAVGLQLIQLEVEDGEVEVTLEASFEGINLGLVSERLDQDLGVWRPDRAIRIARAAGRQANYVATIHHGIPPDLHRPSVERGSYLAFLGRISPEKPSH